MTQLTRQTKYLIKLFYDAAVHGVAYVVCFAFFAINSVDEASNTLILIWAVHLCISLSLFHAVGLYRHVIRFFDGLFVYRLLLPILLSAMVLYALITVLLDGRHVTLYSLVFAAMILVGMGGARVALYHMFIAAVRRNGNTKTILIYGAGSAGVQLAHMLKFNQYYDVLAFIDGATDKQGSVLSGFPVYAESEIMVLKRRHDISAVVLAIPSVSIAERATIVQRLLDYQIDVKTIPALESLLDSSEPVSHFKELDIQDILAREEVAPNLQLLAQDIAHKTILVSGAGGSIGSELCRQILRQQPKQLLLFEVSEYNLYKIDRELQAHASHNTQVVALLGSVQSTERLKEIFEYYAIDTVYHAAAYKHVPLVEHNIIEGVKNNIFGSYNLIQFAVKYEVARFVLVSTDKAVRPTNTMGATKRFAELVMQAYASLQHNTTISIVRFGNVLGSSGSVVPLFTQQIKDGGPITITHPEITRYFMSIPEASQLVIQAGAMAKGGDVFILDMGQPKKIIDLAKNMIRLSGLTLKDKNTPYGDIEICITGLRPGEKLFEELLICDAVSKTTHPKIMTANELKLNFTQLNIYLNRLRFACVNSDYEELRDVLLEAPLNFSPSDDNVDHIHACKERVQPQFKDIS